jgi:(S)-2-hydroxy-acid oxidase
VSCQALEQVAVAKSDFRGSNHGGRQLDGVPATIDALPECVRAARTGGIGVHVDGGIRSGNDLFKAMALGAECCWVGRPAIWGLAVSAEFGLQYLLVYSSRLVAGIMLTFASSGQYDGQKGVELMLQTIHDEFRRCMQLTGCTSVKDITKNSLARIDADGVLKRL